MATHNGADTLDRTLAAMAQLISPAGRWKLVIVNNLCTDDSEALILKWKDRLPLDYLVEPKLGRGVAFNSGLARVEGDFIVMTDDDVLPNRDWLVEWRRIADNYPEYTLFGGAIEPEFEALPPLWLEPAWMRMLYAATVPPQPEGNMVPSDIFGPSMAIRRSVIDNGARFDETLFVGSDGLMGDETDFFNRLEAQGHKACFAPKAVVRHLVQKEQVSWRWMIRRFYRHGRTMHLSHLRNRRTVEPEIFQVPRWAIRRFVESLLRLPFVALMLDEARLFSHLRTMAYDLGTIGQARILAHKRGRHAW
jgi:glycosyltransferase involved in cell wall biosynthesis